MAFLWTEGAWPPEFWQVPIDPTFHMLKYSGTANMQVRDWSSLRSEAQVYICLPICAACWWVLLQHSITLPLFFIVECGIAHFLYTMFVFEVRASSLSLGYLCAKFHFFRGLHCSASAWRKIVYSITELTVDTLYTIKLREVSGLSSFKHLLNQTTGFGDIAYCLVGYFILSHPVDD